MEDSNELSFEQVLDLISEETENKEREEAKEKPQGIFRGVFFSNKSLLAALIASRRSLNATIVLDEIEYCNIFKALCVINPRCRGTVAYPVHEVNVRLAGADHDGNGVDILYYEPLYGGWTFRKGESINRFGWIDEYSDPIRKYKKELIAYSNAKRLALMADNAPIAIQKLKKLTKDENILKVFNNIINADCFDQHFNTK